MFHPKGPSFRELIVQGLSSTKEGYDLLAPKFDYTPFLTSKETVDAAIEALRDEGHFGRAVDLCTGTGAGIGGLKRIVSQEITGIDWSEPMIAEARKKFSGVSSPEIRFVCKDIFDERFLHDYDLVTCFGALGHIPKRRQAEFVEVVHSMLRPGGIFVFVGVEKPRWHHFSAWYYRAFDTIMHVRNYFIKPEFIMYYMNFQLPNALKLFEDRTKWSQINVKSLRTKPALNNLVIARRR